MAFGTYNGIEIQPGTDAQVSKQIQSIDSGSLASSTPLDIAQPKPSTQTDGMLGSIEAGANSFTQNLQETAKQRETASQNSFDAYLSAVNSSDGEIALTDKAYSQTVDPVEAELKDINHQILAEQHSLNRRLEALDKNPQGLYGGALEDEKSRIKDESLKRQADLSVIQLAKQGKFDSAKAIADRAVTAQLERNKNKLDALQLNYERNRDLFDASEKRAFETMLSDRNRELDMSAHKEMARYDQILKQSDPLYALQLAKAKKEIQLLGEPTPAEKKANEAALKEAQASIPVMQDKIQAAKLLSEHGGLNTRVGTTIYDRAPSDLAGVTTRILTPGAILNLPGAAKDTVSGAGQEFAGGVHKLVGGLTLDNLIEAKKRGATFGALSEGELGILASSATAINDWEIKDKDGRGTGFWNIDEASFKKELETIKTLTQRAIQQSGGSLFSSDETEALDAAYKQLESPANYYY